MCNPTHCLNFAASLTPTHTEWHLLDRISILEFLVVLFRSLVWIWEAGRAEQILLGRLSKWLQWRNRLAHGTYRQYKEICRGCEFEPHLEHQHFILTLSQKRRKSFLPDRESNPGLPRDRRRSSPLDYRGLCHKLVIYLWPVTMFNINDRQFISYKGDISKKKNLPILRAGFEP